MQYRRVKILKLPLVAILGMFFLAGCGGGGSNNVASTNTGTTPGESSSTDNTDNSVTPVVGSCPCGSLITQLSSVLYDGNFELNNTPIFTFNNNIEPTSCGLGQPDGSNLNFISVSGDDSGGFCTGRLNGSVVANGGIVIDSGEQIGACFAQIQQVAQNWFNDGRIVAFSDFDSTGAAAVSPVTTNAQLQCE